MPIYEYRCPNGHTFEVFQRMSDPPSSVCEVCGAGPVELLLPGGGALQGLGVLRDRLRARLAEDHRQGRRRVVFLRRLGKKDAPAATTDAKSADAKKSD